MEVILARKFEQTLKSSKILIDEDYFEYAMAAQLLPGLAVALLTNTAK